MRLVIWFAAGTFTSLIAAILLLFGKGWKRLLYVLVALGFMLFYAGTVLVGD